jgi:Zn-dependent protease with chaperone function
MPSNYAEDRRLNPFAFPSETNVRFILFILAALSVSAYITTVRYYLPKFPLENLAVAGSTESGDQLLSQVGESLRFFAFQVGILGLVLVPSTAVYYFLPTYFRRRNKLEPFPQGKDPVFEKEVQRVIELAGVFPPPTITYTTNTRSSNAQAFGYRNKYILRLDGGLRLLMRKSPVIFQALVLHELGHIKNGDVTRAYFSLSLWLVTLLLVASSLLFFSITSDNFDLNDFGLWLQIGAMLAIVTAIWAGLLRVREVYADWRAATFGAEQALATIFDSMVPRGKEQPWDKVWRFHPTARERLAFLQNPTRLFRTALDLPFLCGYLLAIILTGVPLIILPIITGFGAAITFVESVIMSIIGNIEGGAALLVILPAALVFITAILPLLFFSGYLIAGTVGLQVQREVMAEVRTGQQGITGFLRLGFISGIVALGIEIGFLVTPIPIFSPLGVFWGDAASDLVLMIPRIFFWLIGVTVFIWFGLLYARFFGKRLLGSHLGSSLPIWKYRFLTSILSIWLGLAYIPLLAWRIAILYGQSPDYLGVIQLVSIGAIIGLVAMLFLYAVMFGLTWVCILLRQLTQLPHCPMCNKEVHYKYSVAETCEHCGELLGKWLLV